MTSNDFETNRQESLLEYLDIYLDNIQSGMTKAKYYTMCEMMGDEIDPERTPPDFEDFPLYVYHAFNIFNALPDTYTGGMESIYSGKNYSSLKTMYDIHEIALEDQFQVFTIIQHLDNRAKTKAINAAKRRGK